MWTVSAIQTHPRACICCDDDATMELRVKTVKYFKGLMETQKMMNSKPPMGYQSSAAASPKAGNQAKRLRTE